MAQINMEMSEYNALIEKIETLEKTNSALTTRVHTEQLKFEAAIELEKKKTEEALLGKYVAIDELELDNYKEKLNRIISIILCELSDLTRSDVYVTRFTIEHKLMRINEVISSVKSKFVSIVNEFDNIKTTKKYIGLEDAIVVIKEDIERKFESEISKKVDELNDKIKFNDDLKHDLELKIISYKEAVKDEYEKIINDLKKQINKNDYKINTLEATYKETSIMYDGLKLECDTLNLQVTALRDTIKKLNKDIEFLTESDKYAKNAEEDYKKMRENIELMLCQSQKKR